MEDFFGALAQAGTVYSHVFTGFARYAAPVVALLLLLRCCKPLLTFRQEPEIWAWLCFQDGRKVPVTHWENVIGRSKNADIQIDFSTISRNHAVLTRYDDGSWTITDADSRDGVYVNEERVTICALEPEDVISLGGVEMSLMPITQRQEKRLKQLRTKAATGFDGAANLLLLTLLQFLACVGFLLTKPPEHGMSILCGFGGIFLSQWLLFLFYMLINRPSLEVETIAFYLATLGMSAIATVNPGEMMKQLTALGLGLATFLVIGWALRDLERAKRVRYLAAVAGIGFLVITLLFGTEYYGAKNWLIIGGMSLQPSELSKVCFVFVGASTMDRIMNKRNLILLIVYSVVICGCLALMNDFGTALVFFCAFLVMAYLRSGSMGTIGLAVTALVFAGVIAIKIAPHALRRFSAWRHIWEDPYHTGYQQTRALMCLAAGGLLGLGPGKGQLRNVFAADSDIAFATISEEWGLIIAVSTVACILVLGLFTIRCTRMSRSSFYAIGGCTAASILLIQTTLNALGTLDVLPLTGVTFPFLSNGGTSMIGAWGLLAFVKAADTRQNASFAVRLLKGRREEDA